MSSQMLIYLFFDENRSEKSNFVPDFNLGINQRVILEKNRIFFNVHIQSNNNILYNNANNNISYFITLIFSILFIFWQNHFHIHLFLRV
jgi:hypothetical protein